jgi:hypothetical protein
MKLVPKLAAALIAGTFAVLVPNGYLRVQREVAVLRSDRVRDHALLVDRSGPPSPRSGEQEDGRRRSPSSRG